MASNYTEARKEPTGYRHLLSLKWNGDSVDWTAQVLKWGAIQREMSNWRRSYTGGNDSLRFADTDQTLWGSFKGPNGTEMLWSELELESKLAGPDGTFGFPTGTDSAKFGLFKFGEMRFGDVLFSGMINKARTLEMSVQDNEIEFSLADDIDVLRTAKFIWDYTNISREAGVGFSYGTVLKVVNSTTFVIEESSLREFRPYVNNLDIPADLESYTTKWQRLGKYGLIGTDAILPGDVLKFNSVNYESGDAGSLLLEERSYGVNSGSFLVDSGVGTFGTITTTRRLLDVNPGDFIYLRDPLVFKGNPAEIVKDMVSGPNTNVNIPGGSISGTHYDAAFSACAPMVFEHEIRDDSEGAVLRTIQDISEPVEADFWFNRYGRWCWLPYRPLGNTKLDVIADYYDAVVSPIPGVFFGTGNITGRFTWRENVEDIYTDITLDYDYNVSEDEPALAYRGLYESENLETATKYNGMRRVKTIRSNWIKDDNDAVIIGERWLRRHGTAPQKVVLNTSLYGLESDLGDLLDITHRTGSLTNAMFTVESLNMNLDEDTITLSLKENENRKGYGYWNSVHAGSTLDHDVSGTSPMGWSWAFPNSVGSHGTIDSIAAHTVIGLRDTEGDIPNIGEGGLTYYVAIGSAEILKVNNAPGDPVNMTRGVETTYQGTPSTGDPWMAWPMDSNGDILPFWRYGTLGGTVLEKTLGTAHNIDTGSYGTVWRLF